MAKSAQYETVTPAITENDIPYYKELQSEAKAKDVQGQPIRTKLLSSGYATTGRSLSFVLLEPFTTNGQSFKKGQVITGTSKIDKDRLTVRFNAIKSNSKTVLLNARLLGYDGAEGLPIVQNEASQGGINTDGISSEANRQINRIPVVGRVLTSIGTGKGGSGKTQIQLTENTECIIEIFN